MLRALVEIIAAALIPQELSLRWRPRRGKRGSAHRLPHVRENTAHLSSGVYFCRLEAGSYTMTIDMVLLK